MGNDDLYFGLWSDKDRLLKDFEIENDKLKGYKIIIAIYDVECYEGEAFVLMQKGKKLYEVTGGHCSCYGLEGQCDPELTTKDSICKRLDKGITIFREYKNEIIKALKSRPGI